MKKILTLIFIVAICSCLCLTAFADGAEATEEYKSVFDLAKEFVTDNCSEILSLMTFIGSLVIAFTYKKGLLPRLSGALKGIGGSVGELKENTEKSVSEINGKMDEICKESKTTESLCQALGERIEALSIDLDEIKGAKGERERMQAILAAQVDMLYDVFMSSALPQYSKDAVFERINAMKSALAEVNEENG